MPKKKKEEKKPDDITQFNSGTFQFLLVMLMEIIQVLKRID